jgi:formate hydrogenlyase regulatory protein HycA
MAVPEIVPIIHEPGYRTATIGRYAQGQFLASVTYAFPSGFSRGEGWEDQKRLYVVLHRFDPRGRHLHSDIWCSGTWAEQQRHPHGNDSVRVRAKARLAELLDGLPGLEYGDIAIRPFQLSVDGVLFGLVTERHAEDGGEDDWAELYPDRLGFSAPWDGTYDT